MLFLLSSALLLLGLTSCPETKVPRTFGDKPLKLQRADWEGTWRTAGSDDELRIEVADASAGRLLIHWQDQDKKHQETIEALLRDTGAPDSDGLAYMITLGNAGDAWGSVNLVRVPDKGVFHSWNLRHEAVESAVKNGELTGRLKSVREKNDDKPHNHTELSADPANSPKLVEGRFWHWTAPSTHVKQPAP